MTLDTEEQGKLFVGGLSWETTIDKLNQYFCRYGEVTDCVVMKNADTGRSRGFGFVTFKDPSCVQIVLSTGPHSLDGRTIDPKSCNAKSAQKVKREAKLGNHPKIFLGGLPPNINETTLREFFTQYGKVMEVVIMYDQEKKKTRGFGFLSFEHEDAVKKVVADHYVTIDGKKVEVKRAEPKDRQYLSSKAGNSVSPIVGSPHPETGAQGIAPPASWWPPPPGHHYPAAPPGPGQSPGPGQNATAQANGMAHPPPPYVAGWPGGPPTGPQPGASFPANWASAAPTYPGYQPGYPYPYPYNYQQAYGSGYPVSYGYTAPAGPPPPPPPAVSTVHPPAGQIGQALVGAAVPTYTTGQAQVTSVPPPPQVSAPPSAALPAPTMTQPSVVPSANTAQGTVSYAQDASSYGPARVYSYGATSNPSYATSHVQAPLLSAEGAQNVQASGVGGYPRAASQIQGYHPYRRA